MSRHGTNPLLSVPTGQTKLLTLPLFISESKSFDRAYGSPSCPGMIIERCMDGGEGEVIGQRNAPQRLHILLVYVVDQQCRVNKAYPLGGIGG